MSLLTIVQRAAVRIGVPKPSAVASNTDPQIMQLHELVNEEGADLAARGLWQNLVRVQTFTTIAQEIQTGAIPSDFDRPIGNTVWNRTDIDPGYGPISPQDWQLMKASVTAGPYSNFRIHGGEFRLYPVPAAGETMAYEYVSKDWAESSGGTGKAEMTADDDVSRLDEELVRLGTIWRFKSAKGLDYSEEFLTYERRVAQALARDTWLPTLMMAQPGLRTITNVPEGNWLQ